MADGVRESVLSWKELPLDLKRRGLAFAPKLVVADGALGFWKAVGEVWSKVREQPCCPPKSLCGQRCSMTEPSIFNFHQLVGGHDCVMSRMPS